MQDTSDVNCHLKSLSSSRLRGSTGLKDRLSSSSAPSKSWRRQQIWYYWIEKQGRTSEKAMCVGVQQHKSSREAAFPQQGVKDFRKLPSWTNTLPAVNTPQTHLCAKPVMVVAHRCKPDHSWRAGSVFSTSSPVWWDLPALMSRADEKKGKRE